MTRLLQLTRVAALVAVAALVSALPVRAADTASANDMARFLAGLPPAASSPLAELTREGSWQQHARYFDNAWRGLESRQLTRIRDWSKEHLPSRQPTTFYMFSGPDFLYVNAFFPGLHHLRVERSGACRPPARAAAYLAPHAARHSGASARLDRQHPARHVLPHQPDARPAPPRPAQRHLADPLRLPGPFRENRHRCRLYHVGPRRHGQTLRRRADQGRAQRRQDRLHLRRRQAADALLLQHRRLQRRRQE